MPKKSDPLATLLAVARRDVQKTLEARTIPDLDSREGVRALGEVAAMHAFLVFQRICHDHGVGADLDTFAAVVAAIKRETDAGTPKH